MYILMHVGGMPFNGDTIPSGKSLGGSESAAYYIAKELVSMGHYVDLFTNEKEGGKKDGVFYSYAGEVSENAPLGDKFRFISQVPYDVCIIQRHPLAFTLPNNAKLNIWWVHDLALLRTRSTVLNQKWNIDGVFPVSEWHSEQIKEVYDFTEDVMFPTSNGFDYSQITKYNIDVEQQREEKSLVYAARPERGLINLVDTGGIMEMLPDYHLYVCGYDNTTPRMVDFYNYLWSRCHALPNVTLMGNLSKENLLKTMSKCKAYVYPTEFEETFCTMVLEANAVGTPFIGTDAGALSSTLQNTGGKLIETGPLSIDTEEGRKHFASSLVSTIEDKDKWNTMHRHALKRRLTWKSVAEQWLEIFNGLFEKQQKDKYRMAKHFENMSDIVAADKLGLIDHIPEVETNYYFYFNKKYREHYKNYYAYEEKRGVVYGPEKLHGNERFEQVLDVIDACMQKEITNVSKEKPFTILDYGCAHGHYTMNILERIPYQNLFVTGVDIEESNIEKAKKWAEDKEEKRANFTTVDIMEALFEGKFLVEDAPYDLILLGEVLEHVEDPVALLHKIKKYAKPDAHIIITTPYGPWESTGYHLHKGWRAHLHHFERQDLEDLFIDQDNYKLFAVPVHYNLGSFVVYFTLSEKPFGNIDYKRKQMLQAPKETISLCMIAKDATDTLGKTLNPMLPYVDEVILGIDKTSSDEFKDFIARQYSYSGEQWQSYKVKMIDIESPLITGFDVARNVTVEKATCDWVMWLDADEIVDYPENIGKYLRNNGLTAYSLKQVHVCTQPEGHLKTDLPARIFRRKEGVRFWGFVHEHPEEEYNSGMKHVYLLPDCSILHAGYLCEKVRRKRFERNFPLMQKDREKYPDRRLGTFLWLRDLTHMNRYTLEKNGHVITPQMKERSKEAIKIWRSLLKSGEVRFVVEGLAYYSEHVTHLVGENGFEFDFKMEIAHPLSGGRSNFSGPVKGYFINHDDIKALVDYLRKEVTDVYKKKYL